MSDIEALLAGIGVEGTEGNIAYAESRERWDAIVKPVIDAIRESEDVDRRIMVY